MARSGRTIASICAMQAFAALYAALDASTGTHAKLDALSAYFRRAAARDAAWAAYFLSGGRPRQAVASKVLRESAVKQSGLAPWLFDECYLAVGDLAETIALVLPPPRQTSQLGLADWIEQRVLPLRQMTPGDASQALIGYWDELDGAGRFLLTKLIGGGFRVGVSRLLVTRALASLAGLDAKLIAERMMGYTDPKQRPSAEAFLALIDSSAASLAPEQSLRRSSGQPYPFFLAHALQVPVAQFDLELGDPALWQIEWKYDGIRAQLVRRADDLWIWSRGEDLVTERFPELHALKDSLPAGSVLDGEILVWRDHRPAPFAVLQTRIGRKNVSAKLLRDAGVILLAYDVLESEGVDRRSEPLSERRARLEALVKQVASEHLLLAPSVAASSWAELKELRGESRQRGVEGLMLKRRDSLYGVGRTKDVGLWWKWKIEPLTVDAVLIYAQRGHGRRASLYSDYTFAVWNGPPEEAGRTLVPFAKAYSGLTDEEIRKVDAIVNKTTIEKFGPVRSVAPSQVFELGFEGIQRSSRHKSGIAVRFPRMLRWRHDKPVAEADTLAMLFDMLADD
jgi:DNA ligase-1